MQLAALRDLEGYGLCARGRFQLARRLTLNGVVEAPNLMLVRDHMQQLQAQPVVHGSNASLASGSSAASHSSGSGRRAERATAAGGGAQGWDLEPYRAHANLRLALPGHDLTATLGYNQEYLDCSGDFAHVPLAVALDLSSRDRGDGLQYRVGLHQVGARASVHAAEPCTHPAVPD